MASPVLVTQREAERVAIQGLPTEPEALRRLDGRTRRLLSLFVAAETITASR
jgi:hypothetical protein